MKKILIILLLAGLTSCDSLLDVDPTDQYSTDTYWVDQEQYDAALAGCYNSLYNASVFFNGETDMITPNSKAYNESNGTDAIATGSALATTALFSTFWSNAYRGIGRANTLLDKIEDATFDESDIGQMKGEALFIRTLYYSYLIDLFGDCPLILETPNDDTQGDLPRTAKEDVLAQITGDLDVAAGLLPDSYSSSDDVGRVTKGAALALKARILLYNEEWEAAAVAAKDVIDLGVYDLFSDYRGMYMPENENNVEVIFDIQYTSPDFTHSMDHVVYVLNRPAPLKNLVDAYLMDNGESISESTSYDPENPYENRDPRLHQTVACIGYEFNGATVDADDVVTTGFGQKKYTVYPDSETITTVTSGNSDLNFIVIRYAEVLLTYAEALNEAASSPSSEVYWALNKIRSRLTVEMPEIESGLTQDQMREVIRLERRIELACEGLYYSDIRRWKTAEEVNNGAIYNSDGEIIDYRSFDPDRDYLWPIPATEIQENGQLEQNPGW